MWIDYCITDPLRLSEVKAPTPAEMQEYLDLCLKFADDFSYERCLAYWSDDLTKPDTCFYWGCIFAKTLRGYLEFAKIPLSEHDQALLQHIQHACDTAYDHRTCKSTIEANGKLLVDLREFRNLFENKYLKETLRIYTICQILNALHNYNGRLMCYYQRMLTIHELVCKNPLYARYSLHAFDTTGYSNRRTAPNRLNYGYSMADMALLLLRQSDRHELRDSVTYGGKFKYDPFHRMKLFGLLSYLYDDQAATRDIHPLMTPHLDDNVASIIKENRSLYRKLGPFSRMQYRDMKPQWVDYAFHRAMPSGIKIWHNTKFYQKHYEELERALELFDLAERNIYYEYMLPDGCHANETIFSMQGFGGPSEQHVVTIGPSLRFTEDEEILKRIWQDGFRVEIRENGQIIMHSAEESTVNSPWYTERLKREFGHRGQSHLYEACKNVEKPWNPPMYIFQELSSSQAV